MLLDEYNQTKETYRVWNQRLADVEEQILDVRKLLNNKNDYQYKSKTMKRKGYVVGTAKSYLSHNVERPPSNFQITLEDIIKARAALKSTPNNPREDQVIKKTVVGKTAKPTGRLNKTKSEV